MIAVVDYGRGNLGSVRQALERVGARVVVTDDPRQVAAAEALVVPGDGAFADAMDSLDRLGLTDLLRAHVTAGRPYLGICLGYQLLFTASEEFGHRKGLDLVPGPVRRFPPGLKVPHMGWNRLRIAEEDRPSLSLLDGVPDGAYVYFVHSYYPDPVERAGVAVATCCYGVAFPAVLQRGRVCGTQFHPEKSQRWGLRILENFARLAREGVR